MDVPWAFKSVIHKSKTLQAARQRPILKQHRKRVKFAQQLAISYVIF